MWRRKSSVIQIAEKEIVAAEVEKNKIDSTQKGKK